MKVQARITGGKIHEVRYRFFLFSKAMELGCERFFARNQFEDGRQILVALTEGEEFQIEEFKRFAKTSRPEGAEVETVAFEECQGPVMSVDGFLHFFTADQLNKGIPALLRIDRKQDKMLDKQDSMLEKLDTMIDKQGNMLEKQDEMIEALEVTRSDLIREIRTSR
jgi:acylphosphatase